MQKRFEAKKQEVLDLIREYAGGVHGDIYDERFPTTWEIDVEFDTLFTAARFARWLKIEHGITVRIINSTPLETFNDVTLLNVRIKL